MKLNNKGFAITAVLYGLLILFVILVSSYLLVLSAKKDRVEDLTNEIEGSYSNTGPKEILLSKYISNLYKNANKEIIYNNNIDYNYASSVNLMNDGYSFGSFNDEYGNIRYFGSKPNNYIDVGDRDASGNVILWRIIGLFKDIQVVNEDGTTTAQNLIKVIRDESIGEMRQLRNHNCN